MIKYPDSAVEEAIQRPELSGAQRRDFRYVIESRRQHRSPRCRRRSRPAAHVDAYAPGHIALTLSDPAPKGSALVVSENFYPGWHATVDGKPAIAERADLSLIGVALPEGAKKIELNFSSDTYKEGKEITLFALAIGILATLGGLFVPRRPEQAA